MKTNRILKTFVVAFAALCVSLISANFIFARCGNYFKPNHVQLQRLSTGTTDSIPLDDWTGDGKSDFWKMQWNPARAAYDLLIYPAKPTGYWDWDNPIVLVTPINNFQYWRYKEVLDFDSDGNSDIIFSSGLNGFQVYHNTGTGSLTPLPEFSDPQLSGNYRTAFTDLNNDNLLDWLYVYRDQSTDVRELRYKLQNPDGSFSARNTIITGSAQNAFTNYLTISVGDFNGDDKIDIIYNSYDFNTPNKYVIIKNLGGGNFQVGNPVESGIGAYGVRDMNNDGRDDVVNGTENSLIIYYGQPDFTFDRREFPGTYGVPAELNGDNNLDLIALGSTNSYVVMINDGAGGFTKTVYPKNFGLDFPDWKIEDFTGDGKADLFDMTTTSYTNKFINVFGEELLVIRENTCQSGETKFVNFDGNRNADLTVWNPGSGNWSSKDALWGNGAGTTARNFQWGSGAHGDVPAPGDYDGDGKTDYSIFRNSTGVWYIFKSSDSSWYVFPFGLPGDIAVPNDYDGGGLTDIAVFRPSDGNWYIWFTETQTFGAIHFGASGDKPVPADYEGDGKTDIAVYRPSEGNWYYLKSSDFNYVVFHWGIATDIPVPADYDGDSKADIAVYRDGFWWIFRSSTNAYTVAQWGQAGDVPMPVYRNSVSADLIFYRPSNNSWYSYNYSSWPGVPLGGNGETPVYFGLPNN